MQLYPIFSRFSTKIDRSKSAFFRNGGSIILTRDDLVGQGLIYSLHVYGQKINCFATECVKDLV